MKMAGILVEAKYRKEFVILRPNRAFTFKLEAVGKTNQFDEICPQPQPPVITKPGGVTHKDFTDQKYKDAMIEWYEKRTAWIFLKTIAPTEIEWETVNMDDPETYPNYEQELEQAGFNEIEINKLNNEVLIVNGYITDERIKKEIENLSHMTEGQVTT